MTFYKGNSKEAIRAEMLQKRRAQQQEEIEIKKRRIEEENKMTSIDNKFKSHYDAVEQLLKTDTIGLVTLEDMKKKREQIIEQREQQLARERRAQLEEEQARKNKKEKQQAQIQKLSFAEEFNGEEDEGEDDDVVEEKKELKQNTNNQDDSSEKPINETNLENNSELKTETLDDFEEFVTKQKQKKRLKNPDVDTSFLPDRDREREENMLREQLRQEWVERQNKLKNEEIEITYSYWDGSGHRRSLKLKKGQTIQQFLYRCLDQLRKENQFNELKVATVDQLMYVKEDIILPHHYTFYDLIVTKARGKSGPLFIFEAYEDVRIQNDASIEKEESHAGKIVLRSWYERHKHIFPACRWEPFDPEKKYDKPYTVKDSKTSKF